MIESILIKKQIKVTNQRKMILNYINNNNNFTIKDIINSIKNINQSTIYRILSLFEEKNIINKVVINNEVYYSLNKIKHEHYIECSKCHKKEKLNGCPYNNFDLKGFKININEPIKGICQSCQKNEKIGIFIGSFNPLTNAHLEIGDILLNNSIIDKIIYIPCDNLKKDNLIDLSIRYDLLTKTTFNNPNIVVDKLKLESNKSNFDYNDIMILEKKYSKNLYIIIGSDNLLNISNWTNYKYLLENHYFIVINRFNYNDLAIINEKYYDYKDKFIIIDYKNEISSTKVREMIKNNLSVDELLPNEVLNYIKMNNLYK